MDKIIKIILAVLFLLCLLNMPYGFYQIVRFAGMVGFVLLAHQSYKEGRKSETIIYGCLALLFQPFFKIILGRQIWNMMDVIVGIGLILSVFIKGKDSRKQD